MFRVNHWEIVACVYGTYSTGCGTIRALLLLGICEWIALNQRRYGMSFHESLHSRAQCGFLNLFEFFLKYLDS